MQLRFDLHASKASFTDEIEWYCITYEKYVQIQQIHVWYIYNITQYVSRAFLACNVFVACQCCSLLAA